MSCRSDVDNQAPSLDSGSTNTITPSAPLQSNECSASGRTTMPRALTPFTVAAADGDASVERDDDLNRVVRMSGHDALSSGREEEAALPQVPARNAQPAIRRFVVGCVGQAGILPAAAALSVAG